MRAHARAGPSRDYRAVADRRNGSWRALRPRRNRKWMKCSSTSPGGAEATTDERNGTQMFHIATPHPPPRNTCLSCVSVSYVRRGRSRVGRCPLRPNFGCFADTTTGPRPRIERHTRGTVCLPSRVQLGLQMARRKVSTDGLLAEIQHGGG